VFRWKAAQTDFNFKFRFEQMIEGKLKKPILAGWADARKWKRQFDPHPVPETRKT
jgi:hypothetical protein